MTKAIYPGSFDPLTFGHVDIINRALKLFDHLVVAVAINPAKAPMFTPAERIAMLLAVVGDESRITIAGFQTLLVDYATSIDATVIIRGIRAISDFEYEFQMALMNRKLNPQVETVYLTPSAQYSFLSSRLVKEVASFDGNIDCFVPPLVAQKVRAYYAQHR